MSTSNFALRHRLIVIGAAATLGAGTFVATNLAGAASGPSAVDYSQCQNGAPSTSPSPDCTWINGILNASGSQYHEDQVTAQRLTVSYTDTANGSHVHSVTLKYLDRKATIHAYDYLAAADATMADATSDTLRCVGLPVACPQGTLAGGAPSTASVVPAYTADTTHVYSAIAPYSDITSTHMGALTANQKLLKVWGATFTTGLQDGSQAPSNPPAMSTPTHDNACLGCGDDYATTTISFVTPANTGNAPEVHTVELMFGGHLAASTQLDGWGTGLGAASVSGGPYHIKWAAADGVSVGNRDNQIMSGAIIPIVAQGTGLATTPSPTSPVSIGTTSLGSVSDSATLTIADPAHAPTGSVEFDLYGPFTNQPLVTDSPKQCVDPSTGVTGNRLYQSTDTTVTADPSDLTGTKYLASSGNFNLAGATGFGVGWYQWVAHYIPGTDQYNLAADGGCYTTTEQLHVTQAAATGVSTQTVTDTVTVSGYGTPTGHLSWYLYPTSTDCTAGTNATATDIYQSPVGTDTDANNALSSGVATSKAVTISTTSGSNTYYWKVTYDGDTNNAGGTVEDCGTQTVNIQNHP